MTTAVYPGSFDPVTLGHYDIIMRTSEIMDRVVIGVLNNQAKRPLFTVQERVEMLKSVTHQLSNVEIQCFDGLTIDFARQNHAQVIIRGLRAVTDFEYELQLAQTNRVIAPEIDTMFLATSLKYSYLSSSIVKEIASLGGEIGEFLHPHIAEKMLDKYSQMKKQK